MLGAKAGEKLVKFSLILGWQHAEDAGEAMAEIVLRGCSFTRLGHKDRCCVVR